MSRATGVHTARHRWVWDVALRELHGALGSGTPPRERKAADKRGAKQILVQLSVAPSEEIA